MNKKDETLKDLMIELDKTYKTDSDKLEVKKILELGGYSVQYMNNYLWSIDLGNKKHLTIQFGNQPDKRYFHLAIKEETNDSLLDRLKMLNALKEKEQEIVKPHYDKTYMTTQNEISKLLTLKERSTKEILKELKEISNEPTNNTNIQIKTPRDKLWEKIIEREKLNTNELEHHLIINPMIENYSGDKLFDIFTQGMGRFYSQNDILGNRYHKHKDKQMGIYATLEYSSPEIRPDEKKTHIHFLLKSYNPEWLDKLHPFLSRYIKDKIGQDINYQYHLVDTPEYRINVYNYLSKENRKVWTNDDLYNNHKKNEYFTPKLDAYDRILLKTCNTTNYDEVFRKRTEEAKIQWEKYLQDKMNQPIQIQQNNDSNYEEYLTF